MKMQIKIKEFIFKNIVELYEILCEHNKIQNF